MNQARCYKGKAKDMLAHALPNRLIMRFRDDVTAFNGVKHQQLAGKGELNCRINHLVMGYLASHGVATHYIEQIDATSALVEAARVLPIECIFRNRVAGSFAAKYGLKSGGVLRHQVIEFCLKSDELNDPLIAESAITALQLAKPDELDRLRRDAAHISSLLANLFACAGYELIDGKLEFGRLECDGSLVLVDEFTPDSCRLWNTRGEKFDKDLFRQDLGDLVVGYRHVYHSLCNQLGGEVMQV